MRVVITAAAKADLIAIGEFIRPHNPARALHLSTSCSIAAMTSADMPRAYPLVPRYEQWGIRRRVYRDHLIFYRVQSELIEVIHVLNGAQDYDALLLTGT